MQDITHAHRRRRDLVIAAVLIAVAACVPMFVKDVYIQNIMVLTLMYAALSQSWNILGGYCGQISLGHALYFGIGAYTTAILFTKFGVLPWFGMLIERFPALYCGYDADPVGDLMAEQMIAARPEMMRLRPARHDWNDDLRAASWAM